jgi:hypothetical protein
MFPAFVVLEGVNLVERSRVSQVQFDPSTLLQLVVISGDVWTIVHLAGYLENLITAPTLVHQAVKQMVFVSPDSLIR